MTPPRSLRPPLRCSVLAVPHQMSLGAAAVCGLLRLSGGRVAGLVRAEYEVDAPRECFEPTGGAPTVGCSADVREDMRRLPCRRK